MYRGKNLENLFSVLMFSILKIILIYRIFMKESKRGAYKLAPLFFIILLVGLIIYLFGDFSLVFSQSNEVTLAPRMLAIYIFFFSTTFALYIFLYRERKDVSKNYLNNSFQHNIFTITLIVLIFSLFITYNENIVTENLNQILLKLSLVVYLLNVGVTILYSDIYTVTRVRIFLLTYFMSGYIKYFEEIQKDRYRMKISSLLLVIGLIMGLPLIIILFITNIVICIILLVFIFLFILVNLFNLLNEDTKTFYTLSYFNDKAFTTQSGISYVNGNVEKTLENKLKVDIFRYGELIMKILVIDNRLFNDFASEQLKYKNVDKIMVNFYDNILTTYKDIILSNSIDKDISKTIALLLNQMIPIVKFDDSQQSTQSNPISVVNYEYSFIYTNIMIELLTKFFEDGQSYDKHVFFRRYFEKALTDIKEAKVFNNEQRLLSNAVKIECTVLSNLILRNNLRGVIELMPSIIEKKNLEIEELDSHYLKHIIMLLIKSIEIEYLGISGYLVKIICSNYKAESINRTFTTLEEDLFQDAKKERKGHWVLKFHTIGHEDRFIMNGPSLQYCFFKAYLITKIYNYEPESFDLDIDKHQKNRLYNKIKDDLDELDISSSVLERYENKKRFMN